MSRNVAGIELRGVSKVFQRHGDERVLVVDDLSLSIADGEMLAIVGPSGCGKTTTLRMIAGLESPTAGEISVGGATMDGLRPDQRDLAMVFQRDALFPHLNVLDNIALGLRLRRVPVAEGEQRINQAVELLGLKRFLARMPGELSGGERQRVALARAVVRRPKAFLLDEPLASLDAPARNQLRFEIARIHKELGATIIYVTHDQAEALTLGQRVAVLRNGALQQLADAGALYAAPANSFVAGFVGNPPMNLLRGNVVQRQNEFWFVEHNVAGASAGRRLELPLDAVRGARLAGFTDGNVLLGIRAGDVALASADSAQATARVELVERLGTETMLHLTTGAQRFVGTVGKGSMPQQGAEAALVFDLSRAMFFNPASEKAIAF